jgi:hypothetical protein
MRKQWQRRMIGSCLAAVLALATGMLAAIPTMAGTIETTRTALCDVRFSGEVEEGDSDKLVAALQAVDGKTLPPGRLRNEYEISNDVFVPWLCLNSPGGRFDEAVKFIRATLLQVNFATVVEANAECYSACALMFLGGHIHEGDGYFELYRRLSIDGQLGFHAPYIGAVGAGANPKLISASYRAGVLAVADLLSLNEGFFPRGLLAEFLRVGSEELYRIDRVGQLAAWQINLIGYRRPTTFTEDQFENVCHNERTRANRYFTKADLDFSEEVARSAAQSTRKLISPGEALVRWHEEGVEGVAECTVLARLHGGKLFLTADAARATMADRADQSFISNAVRANLGAVDPDAYTAGFFLYPQHMAILSLERSGPGDAPASAPAARPAAASSVADATAAEVSLWDHNGSTMRLRLLPGSAIMAYQAPREGIRKAGAKPGDTLFTVARNGERLSGSSSIFSRRCGNREFPVSGTISPDLRTIRLSGRAPSLGSDCETKGWVDQDLVFSYISAAE